MEWGFRIALFCMTLIALPATAQVPAQPSSIYTIRHEQWNDADEREYRAFIAAIGESGCRTVDRCLHDAANPFRKSDPDGIYFRADCADLPYSLRFYFAWKKGLPFSYQSKMEPRGRSRDFRYSRHGNGVVGRRDLLSGAGSGYRIMEDLRHRISSAAFRVPPELESPFMPDFYSPQIDARSIGPGTIIYDPNGHVAVVYKVESDGRVRYMDAHPDNSLTRGVYDPRFVRAHPNMSAGFKNWRPLRLVGAKRAADGVLWGGQIQLAPNKRISDFSLLQFYGNGARPSDANWRDGSFALDGKSIDYYDFVRARVAGGKLEFDPVREISDMTDSICSDLEYRREAVDMAVRNGLHLRPQPKRLPPNIYGTEGDWENYSTPSRDARLKMAFRELRDTAQRFVEMYARGDARLKYRGRDLVGDMIAAYDRRGAICKIAYSRSDKSIMKLSFEETRKRLFSMSFDPYHCPERRWGASDARELSTCPDDATKRAWYDAEQGLRNQLDRTYETRMDFDLAALRQGGPGRGAAAPPDVDVRRYLLSVRGTRPPARPRRPPK